MPLTFDILHRDAASGARVGRVTTPHGSYETPVFMPVGTQATVKGLLPEVVAGLGSRIILANTYHLMLRPGSELVAKMGGLHPWMRWNHPILTDSGGFQVFSLGDINKITDDGVIFKSHIDGQTINLTPERSIQVQNQLGADIIMAFDDCPPAAKAGDDDDASQPISGFQDDPSADSAQQGKTPRPTLKAPSPAAGPSPRVLQAAERSVRWLERCIKAHERKQDQALFAIVQGGVDMGLRDWCVREVLQHDLPGYAIGGVAVGETFEQIKLVVEHTARQLPEHKPRYLMGVGYERDILAAVRAGVDMFDCVLPTRNGRNASAFTPTGAVRLRNAKYATDGEVIDSTCDCIACKGGFSRGYLRHLFNTDEMLGPILVSAHNIRHFHRYMLDIRHAIVHNDWSGLYRRWPVALPQNGIAT